MIFECGFRTSGLRHIPLREALRGIDDTGYSWVEFCLEHPESSISTLQEAREMGLRISSISFHGKHDDKATRTRQFRRAVEMAKECSVDVIVLGSPSVEVKGFQNEALEMYRLCDNVGLKPAWETEPGTVLSGLDEFWSIIAPLGQDAGINLDAGHLHLQGRCTDLEISRLGRRIFHVHVEGMNRLMHNHLIPGKGDLDWSQLFRGLLLADYCGPLIIDLFDIRGDWRSYIRKARFALAGLMEYYSSKIIQSERS